MPDVIHLLPDSVANQIAAGEVVDRPASVVKELVENSIDAGASRIQIVIKDAGRTLIQVTDNGKGMSETDARMAFERHATSKIAQAEDLYNLHTMGFRGEALASIAAVTQVELRTRRKEDDMGICLQIDGSHVVSQKPVVCEEGSNFMVRNLFFNLPARRHFLKSDTTEFSHILTVFNRIAIVYPEVSFMLTHNDTLLHDLKAGSLLQRVSELFGTRVKSQLLPIHAETPMGVIDGFVGRPESATKHGGNQYFFVNGRYMWHPSFHKAVVQAYERMLQPGTMPAYFITLTVPPAEVDVNVHPQKTEVKFRNEKPMWSILLSTVREALGKFSVVPDIDFDNPIDTNIPVRNARTEVQMPSTGADPTYNPFKQSGGGSSYIRQKTMDWESLYQGFAKQKSHSEPVQPTLGLEESVIASDELAEEKSALQPSALMQRDFLQFGGKYIVTVVKSGLMLIDLRRAHIRVLYEKFLANLVNKRGISQRLLFPSVVTLNVEDANVLQNVVVSLQSLGFEVTKKASSIGDETFEVSALPAEVDENCDPVRLLRDVIDNVRNNETMDEELLQRKLALSLAQGGAVPYGKKLTTEELAKLTASLFSCRNCNNTPDGHVILTVLSDADFQSRFK